MRFMELFAHAYTMVLTALGITEETETVESEVNGELTLFPVEEIVVKKAPPVKRRKSTGQVTKTQIVKAVQDYVEKYGRYPSVAQLEKETDHHITRKKIYRYFKGAKALKSFLEMSVFGKNARSKRNRVVGDPIKFLMEDLYKNILLHREERSVSMIIIKYCTHSYDTYIRHIGKIDVIVKELELRYGIKMHIGQKIKAGAKPKKRYSERYCEALREKLIQDYCYTRSGSNKPLTLKEYNARSAISSVRNYVYRICDHSGDFIKEAEAYYLKDYRKAA